MAADKPRPPREAASAGEPAAPHPAVHFHSLGCPKNQLDTEVMLGRLAVEGFTIAERLEDADAVVINTCAFIESAREESIQAILEMAEERRAGRLRALVVAGCLPQRYAGALARELPEVDAFVGTGTFPRIAEILRAALEGRGRGVYVEAGRTHLYDERDPRILLGAGHSAYVKIAEGCDRVCTFCAIPGIRGAFRSRRPESVLEEVRQLAALGVRELNLVAQDSTSFGKDLPGRPRLAALLRALDELELPEVPRGLPWIRILYLYPSAVTDELVEALAAGRRLLPYVDVPLQHASDRVLRAMRRGTTRARQERLVQKLRSAVPDLTLRTTVIVGFPGETDEDFDELLDFVRWARFDRLGVFRYSDEEGTAAAGLSEKVPREVARERFRRLVELQTGILEEKLRARVGHVEEVLVDRVGPAGAVARLRSQAPEVDGVTHVRRSDPGVRPGDLLRVRITGSRGVDLVAEVEGVGWREPPPLPPPHPGAARPGA